MMKPTNIAPDLLTAKDSLIEETESIVSRIGFPFKGRFLRIEQHIFPIEPLRWLQQQVDDVKIYWSERDEQYEMAGIGCADIISGDTIEGYDTIFNSMRSDLNPEFRDTRYYGGFQFDKNKDNDSVWESFGTFKFFVPHVEVVRDNRGTRLALNIRCRPQLRNIHNSIAEMLDRMKYDSNFSTENQTKPQSRSDVPAKEGWFQNFEKTRVLFQREVLKKIALARVSTLEFSDKASANGIINRIKSASQKAFHFYFQPKKEVAFLGASPELLFRRTNNRVFTEAMAGTRPCGKSEGEDEKLRNDLLNSPKDIYEHALVCQFIEETMRALCSDLTTDDGISIIKVGNLQHLYKRFQGVLKAGYKDADIIAALHPTPAVGGLPKETALREIETMEEFNRGWYAGPIGWVGADSAEFVVGIRSGLVHQNKLYLYTGAGIVPESHPEQEWQELEQKTEQFLKIFQD